MHARNSGAAFFMRAIILILVPVAVLSSRLRLTRGDEPGSEVDRGGEAGTSRAVLRLYAESVGSARIGCEKKSRDRRRRRNAFPAFLLSVDLGVFESIT